MMEHPGLAPAVHQQPKSIDFHTLRISMIQKSKKESLFNRIVYYMNRFHLIGHSTFICHHFPVQHIRLRLNKNNFHLRQVPISDVLSIEIVSFCQF